MIYFVDWFFKKKFNSIAIMCAHCLFYPPYVIFKYLTHLNIFTYKTIYIYIYIYVNLIGTYRQIILNHLIFYIIELKNEQFKLNFMIYDRSSILKFFILKYISLKIFNNNKLIYFYNL